MNKSTEWQRIFKVAAEGGCIMMMGCVVDIDKWIFAVVRDESVLSNLLDEISDEEATSQTLANTWTDALILMDRYPWHKMYPQGPFHSDFHSLIWDALIERDTV